MIIIHCVSKRVWESYQGKEFYKTDSLKTEGFIHCSDIENFHKVAAFNFKDVKEKLLLLCLEVEKIQAQVKWEDGGNGTLYPHIYGELNLDAVVEVLPYLRDEYGEFVLNEELENK